MSRFAIDAPTLLHILAADLTPHQNHQLVAPSVIRSHILDLLLAAVARGEMSERLARRLLNRVGETKMRLLGDRVSRSTAWQIAREHGWDTTREAEYIAVTKLQADALVTIDPTMKALARGLVPLASLQVLTDNGGDTDAPNET